MIRTGLLSVTFRSLSPEEIVSLACQAGVDGIEWGGDIHVPHGDIRSAGKVGRMTREAGLQAASYGSYYRVGTDDEAVFRSVLETAAELEAPAIRVWAGERGSAEADEAYWDKVIADSKRIAGLAEKERITISFEYHGNTLTDTNESALRLLRGAEHPNIRTHWQPPFHLQHMDRLAGLNGVVPWLMNMHVHYFSVGFKEHKPLYEGREEWLDYLRVLTKVSGGPYAMLEFVKDGTPEQFLKDAAALKEFASEAAACSD